MFIEFDTYIMRHAWLKGKVTHSEKTCICVSDRYKFSPPLFTDNTFTNWFQLDSSTAMYSRGKIFKGGELETTVRVISLQKNYKITL